MNTLADLSNYVVTALQRSGRCSAVRVLDTQSFAARQYAIKVRAELLNGDVLQIRIYRNSGHVGVALHLIVVMHTTAGSAAGSWQHYPERCDGQSEGPQLSVV